MSKTTCPSTETKTAGSSLKKLLPILLLLPLAACAATSPFEGRWRLDKARSTALDGWTAWDLVIQSDGSFVSLRHDMEWRSSRHTATNSINTAQPVTLENFFRVEQRHMAEGQAGIVQSEEWHESVRERGQGSDERRILPRARDAACPGYVSRVGMFDASHPSIQQVLTDLRRIYLIAIILILESATEVCA